MFSTYIMIILRFAVLLAYLAGLGIAIWLLIQTKNKAAILAAVSFGLLALISLGQIVLSVPLVAEQLFFASEWLSVGLTCCCTFLDVIAIVGLIVAIWQGV